MLSYHQHIVALTPAVEAVKLLSAKRAQLLAVPLYVNYASHMLCTKKHM